MKSPFLVFLSQLMTAPSFSCCNHCPWGCLGPSLFVSTPSTNSASSTFKIYPEVNEHLRRSTWCQPLSSLSWMKAPEPPRQSPCFCSRPTLVDSPQAARLSLKKPIQTISPLGTVSAPPPPHSHICSLFAHFPAPCPSCTGSLSPLTFALLRFSSYNAKSC